MIATLWTGWHNSQLISQAMTAVDSQGISDDLSLTNGDLQSPRRSRAPGEDSSVVASSFQDREQLTDSFLLAKLSKEKREIAALEQLTFELVNQYRAVLDLAPLELNPQISEQARIHSENMASFFVPLGHDGFKSRLAALKETITYRSGSENVAYNFGYSNPVSEAIIGWINSPGHHQTMVGNYNLTGIGVAKNDRGEYYLTQIFILER
ncbi:MAG: CAP domain-containing protein [Pleurocapsa sp.]